MQVTKGDPKTRLWLLWEYQIKSNDLDEGELNSLGQDGWELIPICREDKLYFRRQSILDEDKH